MLGANGESAVARGDSMVPALATGWQGTFAFKETDLPFAEAFAEKWVQPLDTSAVTPPSGADFGACALRTRASAPGPDGLPYAAWGYAGAAAWESLEQAADLMLGGRSPPRWFMQKTPIMTSDSSLFGK